MYVMTDAPGSHKPMTALHPEGDPYLSSDVIYGAKESLIVASVHHLLVGVAWAPVVGVIPRAYPSQFIFLSLSSPCLVFYPR
jgi:hypothetical protein